MLGGVAGSPCGKIPRKINMGGGGGARPLVDDDRNKRSKRSITNIKKVYLYMFLVKQ